VVDAYSRWGQFILDLQLDTDYPFHKDNVWVAESGYTGTPTFHSFDGGWYDPTAGEGGMLTQDSESFQPLIVSNGTYLGRNRFF
jgi:hypothetical protein